MDDFAQQRYCSKAMERQNSSEGKTGRFTGHGKYAHAASRSAMPPCGIWMPAAPVSYTHLDVYKRQGEMHTASSSGLAARSRMRGSSFAYTCLLYTSYFNDVRPCSVNPLQMGPEGFLVRKSGGDEGDDGAPAEGLSLIHISLGTRLF